jgi:DNA-binding CsgD family transcriptional regulator
MEPMGCEYRRMLDLAVAVLEGEQDPWRLVGEELGHVLGVDLAGCFHLQWPSGTLMTVDAWPAWAALLPWAPHEVLAHPLVRHHALHGDPQPHTTGDVPDDLEWLNDPIFAEARDRFGMALQHLLIPLRGGSGRVRYVGGARTGVPYDVAECAYLQRVQPLLQGIDSHHRTLSRLRQPDDARPASAAGEFGLTPREEAVLGLVAEGLTIQAIAHRLEISPHTVVKHQQHLYRKLGTGDRLSAVLIAQRHGLTDALPRPC